MIYNGHYDPFITFAGEGGFEIYLSSNQTLANRTLALMYNEDWMYYGVSF